jgi:hypothetical protein
MRIAAEALALCADDSALPRTFRDAMGELCRRPITLMLDDDASYGDAVCGAGR